MATLSLPGRHNHFPQSSAAVKEAAALKESRTDEKTVPENQSEQVAELGTSERLSE